MTLYRKNFIIVMNLWVFKKHFSVQAAPVSCSKVLLCPLLLARAGHVALRHGYP